MDDKKESRNEFEKTEQSFEDNSTPKIEQSAEQNALNSNSIVSEQLEVQNNPSIESVPMNTNAGTQSPVSQNIEKKKWYNRLWFKICAVIVCVSILIGAVGIGFYAVKNSKNIKELSGFAYQTSTGGFGLKIGENNFVCVNGEKGMCSVALDENNEYALFILIGSTPGEGTLYLQQISKVGKEPMRMIGDEGNSVGVNCIFRGEKLYYRSKKELHSIDYKDEKATSEKIYSGVETYRISKDGKYAVISTENDKVILLNLKNGEEKILADDAEIVKMILEKDYVIINGKNGLLKCDFNGNIEKLAEKEADIREFIENDKFFFSVKNMHSVKIGDIIDDDMFESDQNNFTLTKENIAGTNWRYSKLSTNPFGYFASEDDCLYQIDEVDGNKVTIYERKNDDIQKYQGTIDENCNIKFVGKTQDGSDCYVTMSIVRDELVQLMKVKTSLQGYDGAALSERNYYLSYSEAREKISERNAFRNSFDMPIEYADFDLYYYDGKKANKIDTNIVNLYDADEGIAVYNKLNADSKIKISSIDTFAAHSIEWDIERHKFKEFGEKFLYDKGKITKEFSEKVMNADGIRIVDSDIFLYFRKIDGQEIYRLSKEKGYKECEKIAEKVEYSFIESKDKVYFGVEVDISPYSRIEPTLYFNDQKIAENVIINDIQTYENGIFFYQNFNLRNQCGDLYRFDGKNTQKIASNVRSYEFDEKAEEIYVITDWEDGKGGTLKKWNGGENFEKIAENVIEINRIEDLFEKE